MNEIIEEENGITEPAIEAVPEEETEERAENETETETQTDDAQGEEAFYRALIESDLEELRLAFPETRNITDITELENPLRYARLRDLGLSAKEAYLATSPKRHRIDTRAHLTSAVSRIASSPKGALTKRELDSVRDLFAGMSDSEIQNLYKKVTV